ncbi:MAG: hypothetical protein J0H07_11155 [Sphingobacteriales bacterium]|nr:hypothetical protein [Sphingobacteriales bacterium]
MDKKIFTELHELRLLLAKVVGTADQPKEKQFSEEAIANAAKAYRKMTIDRGDWLTENELPKYLGPCPPWRAGAFIQEAFAFNHVIKKGREYLYYKKDIEALGQEVKAHNINLRRYKEFIDDKAAFDKKVAAAKGPAKKGSKDKRYQMPPNVNNITTNAIPKPDAELVRQDLANLKTEFNQGKYEAYIDVYKGTHAMLKFMYHFEKYLEPSLKRRCKKWCDNFNYANHALELITGKMQKMLTADCNVIEL